MSPAQLEAAIEAAGRLQRRLIEAKAGIPYDRNGILDNAHVALETVCITMDRKIEARPCAS